MFHPSPQPETYWVASLLVASVFLFLCTYLTLLFYVFGVGTIMHILTNLQYYNSKILVAVVLCCQTISYVMSFIWFSIWWIRLHPLHSRILYLIYQVTSVILIFYWIPTSSEGAYWHLLTIIFTLHIWKKYVYFFGNPIAFYSIHFINLKSMEALIESYTHFDFISEVSSTLHKRSPSQIFPMNLVLFLYELGMKIIGNPNNPIARLSHHYLSYLL